MKYILEKVQAWFYVLSYKFTLNFPEKMFKP